MSKRHFRYVIAKLVLNNHLKQCFSVFEILNKEKYSKTTKIQNLRVRNKDGFLEITDFLKNIKSY